MINKLVNYVIRPTRTVYDPQKDLGPDLFYIDNVACGRINFRLTNQRKQTIVCSMYHRSININQKYPCVLYCHGNSGNRTSSFESLRVLLSQDIFVVCFDFPGCGLSDGDVISLGYYEHFDIECVIDFVLEKYDFIDPDRLGLWGRSMGAVAAIYYSARTDKIKALLLDSPFSSFPVLLKDYLNRYKFIARITGKYIERNMTDKIRERAKFDIHDLLPINEIPKIRCPITMIHGKSDSLVLPKHSRALFEKIKGEKEIIVTDGGHNDIRPSHLFDKLKIFWVKHLVRFCEQLPNYGDKSISIISDLNPQKLANPEKKSNETEQIDHPDEEQKESEHQKSNFRRVGKRKLGIVPIDMLDKSQEPPTEDKKEEQEISSNDFAIPTQRKSRRSKLFFVPQTKQLARYDSSDVIDCSDPQSLPFKNFGELVCTNNANPSTFKRDNKRRKLFFKFPTKRPEYVIESDISQLIQLDDVFSSVENKAPENEPPKSLLLAKSSPFHHIFDSKISAPSGDSDVLMDIGSEPADLKIN